MFGTRLGLECTRELADICGAPDKQLRFIHVAGTNGKGSVCAMLESIYRSTGLRVGLYTSPHLVAFGERIQVNRQPISEADIIRLTEGIQAKLKHFPAETHPTFFEVVTVMALQYFAEQKCDLVIWETGLGGRLDATNIVTPLTSVITNIAFDHMAWLGDTLGKIAAEKAGIIKPGIPVITGAEAPEALAVIRDTAKQKGSLLIEVNAADADALPQSPALQGAHQRMNAAVTLATVQQLQELLPVSAPAITQGLATVHWPGRLQLVEMAGGQRVLLDGAHNEDGVTLLTQHLREKFSTQKPVLIMGALVDKDWKLMCRLLAPLVSEAHLVPVGSTRTAAPSDLAVEFQRANPCILLHVHETLGQALAASSKAPFRLVTGSLYLIGEAMEKLAISAVPTVNERVLNEWGKPR